MRETQFIKQNKDKWEEFEHILGGQYRDPEKLSDLFVQVTDDLSYSRTFYPNRSVRVYLNDLAQRVFFRIYRTRRSQAHRLLSFWTDELPQLIYESRQEFRLSFWVFTLAFLVGVLSSAMDPDFPRVILGDAYVDMTIANIESGDPMAVYKERGAFGMSLGITANNLFVAFLTFVMGALFGVGSIAIMISNGIMVGAFQYFFISRGLFWDSFLTIWIHGTLEISAIIIAGAAGLTMGRGLVFPGTFTRLQAFQQSARRGIKIMLGITPIIILAGFIEGFLTRYTETPYLLRGLFILVCLAFVLLYFVWYPRVKARLGFDTGIRDNYIPPDSTQAIDFTRIKSAGEIFSEVFVLLRKHGSRLALTALATSLLFSAAVFLSAPVQPTELFRFPNHLFGTLAVINQFFVNPQLPLLPVINIAVFTILTLVINTAIIRQHDPSRHFAASDLLLTCIKVMAGVALMQIIMWTNEWYTFFLILLLFPIPLIWNFIMQEEGSWPWLALGRTFFLLGNNYDRALSLFLTLAMIGLLFFSIVDSIVFWFYLDLISWIVQLEETAMNELSVVILTITTLFFLHLIVGMVMVGMGLLYYTLVEIQEAPGLLERIRSIGTSRKIQGMEKE